jgi:hypothetical protein
MMSFLAPAGPEADSAHDIHHSVAQDKQAESEEARKQKQDAAGWPNDGEPREIVLGTRADQRYSRIRMPTKPTPFLHPNPLQEPELLATAHSRVIFCVGSDRFAVDITSTVTELKPQPAEVIPIGKKSSAKRRRVGPVGMTGVLL